MGFATALLTVLSIYAAAAITSSRAQQFKCSGSSGTTCNGLVGYVSPNHTTLSHIKTFFGITRLRSLLGANNFPLSTPGSQAVAANQTIKIPFQCLCTNGTGLPRIRRPIYKVVKDDYLYYIATEVFSGLVTYQQIQTVNNITDANLIEIRQELWIPLPCSCDEVDGVRVVHYGHVVKPGSTVEEIAQQYSTTVNTLLKLNGLSSSEDLRDNTPFDVPLKACESMVGNNSLDYPLLVANGTYTFTANNCVICKCDAANNWTLQCEPSQVNSSTACPSMQCEGAENLYLGNTTSSSCNRTTCAYAGYYNQTILTTLVSESLCPDKQTELGRTSCKREQMELGSTSCNRCFNYWNSNNPVRCIRRYSSGKSMIFWNKENEIHQNIEAILKNFGGRAPKRYSYSDVKKMTNSLKEKLGQGGYGKVYKGKLKNGSPIAVKFLNESKGNGEEFINEVASISRTSHVNIVTLLGFCFERRKRALIYEFMPNGSLEKFIYDVNFLAERQLGWKTLYQIAVGIARGLEYLHCGCNTRILHLDIKPHNILLDEDFCPKISDFGLAKLCPKKESTISMSGTRGTIGYIAPKYLVEILEGVSHKPDVYSYGMMILEIAGEKKNVHAGVGHTSEYFPDWIYRRLELDDEIGHYGITNEEENERARKMVIVGLWCIQTNPSSRPTMSRVVDMLEGSLESLQIPPRPFLSSPPRALVDSSSSTKDNLALCSSDICSQKSIVE